MCQFCYGANETQCVLCEQARYNGICMDACPHGRYPNRANGNDCECPKNYVGENCTGIIIIKKSHFPYLLLMNVLSYQNVI